MMINANTMVSDRDSSPFDGLFAILMGRYSARAFLPEVLPRERIERLLATAGLAPSWCNTQPWKVYVTAGQTLRRISQDLLEAARDRSDQPDIPFASHYPAPYDRRKWEADERLRLARGLEPSDYRGMVEAIRSNWRFFGAPQALFLTVPKALGPYALLDLGCFLHGFLLACAADHLAACPQASLVQYPSAVRTHLPIGVDELIVCGVSFGVPDASAHSNQCRTTRVPLAEFVYFQKQ
jgi:nitroreductase